MPTTISDGAGSGSVAKVTEGRLQVESNIRPFISFKAKNGASAYSLTSTITSGLTAGNFIFAMKYTGSTGGFVVARVELFADQAFVARFHKATGTASGTDVPARQLNFGSSQVANITGYGSGQVTGLTSSYHYREVFVEANVGLVVTTDDVPILTPGFHYTVELESIPGSSPTRVSINVFGYESDLVT